MTGAKASWEIRARSRETNSGNAPVIPVKLVSSESCAKIAAASVAAKTATSTAVMATFMTILSKTSAWV
jgi:hypothetical protein